jgi:hypothetical protein
MEGVMTQEDRIERVTEAVLQDEFVTAAAEYAFALMGFGTALDTDTLRGLMVKREKFVNAYAMLLA